MTDGGGEQVLVVDDDELLQRLVRDILATRYQVHVAPNGPAALALLAQHRVDAIVADQMMPGMTGVELLRQAITAAPQAARILVTASGRVEDAMEAINVARVTRFAGKPFRPLDLLSTVGGAINEAKLEHRNSALVVELKEKNELLSKALSQVQAQERKLTEEVERRTRDLREAVAKLEDLALRDGLTGLYNHRYFQEAFAAEIARAGRHNRTVALVFIDIDHFKNFNDLNGHPAGDELLRQVARILKNTGEMTEVRIRGRISDIACRYGGEEFTLILPEATKAGGKVRAERLRSQIADFAFPGRESQPGGKVTVSIGVSSYPEDAITKQDLIGVADQALYASKRAGRNRVCGAGEQPAEPAGEVPEKKQ